MEERVEHPCQLVTGGFISVTDGLLLQRSQCIHI